MTHDKVPSTYQYNNLDQQSQQSDAKSSTDTSPQVSTFTYTPAGQVLNAVKPNGNTVANTYYANNLPSTVTEKTSGGTLVSSHQYTYDPNGNTTQNVEQLMSADTSSSYLNHTLAYTYTPMDQVASVSTDGTQTESYTHDANNEVTAQTVNGTSTTYGYSQGQLATATAGGSTADYNYDPFGRLDTVTAAGATLQSNTYDGFDNLASTTHMSSSGSATTTSYTYDSLNRMATQTTGAGTTSFSYLGASSQVASESDPGSTSKTYDYTPAGGGCPRPRPATRARPRRATTATTPTATSKRSPAPPAPPRPPTGTPPTASRSRPCSPARTRPTPPPRRPAPPSPTVPTGSTRCAGTARPASTTWGSGTTTRA
jgi:YD repeat-containing protein